jgi:hypothetical protein
MNQSRSHQQRAQFEQHRQHQQQPCMCLHRCLTPNDFLKSHHDQLIHQQLMTDIRQHHRHQQRLN